jgi:hypothetical protein
MKATLKSIGITALSIAMQALLQALLQHAGLPQAIAGGTSIGAVGLGAYLTKSPLQK